MMNKKKELSALKAPGNDQDEDGYQ